MLQEVQLQHDEPQPDDPQPSLTTTLEGDPDNIEELFSDFLYSLHEKIRISKEMILSRSIRLIDSGGQPYFHELLFIFLSGFVSVFKLSESLSTHGEVVFYNEAGNPTNDPYESHYSHEQVIRHDLQAIQSEATRSGIDQMPSLAFAGTFFRDESLDAKDERLHTIITEMLPPEMQQCVITNGRSLREVTFRINARSPEEQDFDTVGRLKGALMLCSQAKPRDLPLKWYGYEVALQMLMQKSHRQSLSRQECEFIAYKLGFDLVEMNAALNYLRQLNIIAYYKVLPNVIFGSSQVVLDKVTELVCYSLQLKERFVIGGIGLGRKFVQQGIISLKFLKSPALFKHYNKLFGPEDLLKVLVSLLVVSEVSLGEYFVPCVLDVCSIFPSSPLPEGYVHSSFILHFSKESPMFGIYCCTVSSLMSDAGWRLLTEDGDVVQVARNSITFEAPRGFAGKVTFLDPLSSYLEVTVELPNEIVMEHGMMLYAHIRDAFTVAVEKAMEMLHYKARAPKVSFLCPEPKHGARCSMMPHLATLDDTRSSLKSSLKPGSVYHPLTEQQKIWLTEPTFSHGGKLYAFYINIHVYTFSHLAT